MKAKCSLSELWAAVGGSSRVNCRPSLPIPGTMIISSLNTLKIFNLIPIFNTYIYIGYVNVTLQR